MCNSLSLSSLQSDWLGTNQERRDHHTHSGRRLRLANAWPSHSSLLFCFYFYLFPTRRREGKWTRTYRRFEDASSLCSSSSAATCKSRALNFCFVLEMKEDPGREEALQTVVTKLQKPVWRWSVLTSDYRWNKINLEGTRSSLSIILAVTGKLRDEITWWISFNFDQIVIKEKKKFFFLKIVDCPLFFVLCDNKIKLCVVPESLQI